MVALTGTEQFVGLQGAGPALLGTAAQIKTWTSLSPTLVTPTLGVATTTSINKVAITAPATGATLTIADGKTLMVNNSPTIAGTDSTVTLFGNTTVPVASQQLTFAGPTAARTITFPDAAITVARTDAAQTFTGTQTSDTAFVVSRVGSMADTCFKRDTTGGIYFNSSSGVLQIGYNSGAHTAFAALGITVVSDLSIGFSSTSTGTSNIAAMDTGLKRSSAGIVEVNNGTAGTYRDLKARDVIINGATNLLKTSAALTDNAAAQVGTLTNAPTAGNPTKWVRIDDNGTARFIPCW